MSDKEQGFSVCQGGKVIGLVHNHPSGNISPSKQDMQTAEKHKVVVCVQTHHDGNTETRCYRPKRK